MITVKEYFEGDIPWIKTGELNQKYISDSEEKISRQAVEKSSAKIFPRGSVGIAMYGATIGKLAIWKIDASTNQACAVAKIDINLLFNEFLYYFLLSEKSSLIKAGKGGAQPNISQGIIKSWEINLPPLSEQHRIVAKIEELFSEIDKGVESLKTAKAQLQVYRQALLKHAFEGKLTAQWRSNNPDKVLPAAELLRSIEQSREERYQQQLTDWQTAVEKWEFNGKEGKKPSQPKALEKWQQVNSNLDSLNYSPPITGVIFRIEQTLKDKPNNGRSVTDKPGGFRVLRLTCLNGERIDLNQNKEGNWEYPEAKNYIVKQGDFLISRGNGSIKLVGRGGVVSEDKDVAYPDTMIRLPVDENIFRSNLFSLFWNSALFRQQIEHSARTTAGIYKINQQLISNYLIPCFSLQEQDQILNILEAKTTTIDYLLTDIDNNLKKAEALRQSILKKAFSGQLVPQDPNDEPASELLKRIQAEKAERETKTKRKSTKQVTSTTHCLEGYLTVP